MHDFAPYLPKHRTIRREIRPSLQPTGLYLDDLAGEIAEALIADYGAQFKQAGWIASLCPAGHATDYPGKHFCYHPQLHLGHCFGKHGRLLLKDLKVLINANAQAKRLGFDISFERI